MATLKIEIGTKLNMQLDAVKCYGQSENNPIVTWQVDTIKYCESGVDWVTFKGKKALYRFCGMRIYSITGPSKEYKICD